MLGAISKCTSKNVIVIFAGGGGGASLDTRQLRHLLSPGKANIIIIIINKYPNIYNGMNVICANKPLTM
jgi:hypothetical protein